MTARFACAESSSFLERVLFKAKVLHAKKKLEVGQCMVFVSAWASAVGGMKSPNGSHEWPELGPWGQDDKGGERTLG